MNKVLVTGASGFLGYNSVQMLKSRGFEVHATQLKPIQHREKEGIRWYQADLRDKNQIHQLIEKVKPTHLLHAAWNMEPGIQLSSEHHCEWVDIGMNLIESFAHFGGKRFVAIGSAIEYGPVTSICVENKTQVRPDSLYGKIKLELQLKIDSFCKENGISYAWPRVFLLFGPKENPKRIVPYVIRSIMENKIIKTSHGNQILDYLYVDDVVNAFGFLLEGDLEGPVNVSSGKPIQLKDIIINIAKKMDGEHLLRFGTRPTSEHDPMYLVGDNTLLKTKTGWQQKVSIEEGIVKLIKIIAESK